MVADSRVGGRKPSVNGDFNSLDDVNNNLEFRTDLATDR